MGSVWCWLFLIRFHALATGTDFLVQYYVPHFMAYQEEEPFFVEELYVILVKEYNPASAIVVCLCRASVQGANPEFNTVGAAKAFFHRKKKLVQFGIVVLPNPLGISDGIFDYHFYLRVPYPDFLSDHR